MGGQGVFSPGFLRLRKVSGMARTLSELEWGYPGDREGRGEGTGEAGRAGYAGALLTEVVALTSRERWPGQRGSGRRRR